MKQFFTFLGIMAMGATAYGQADKDIVNIPDANFKRALVENTSINTNRDTQISYAEARAYTGRIDVSNKNISSLEGIEAFINITELNCFWNQLTSLDVSKNTALQILFCDNNQLTSLDVSGAIALKELDCSNNQLTNLDVSGATALQILFCGNNQLTSLDVSKNVALQRLFCDNNQLTSLDVSKNTALERLDCEYNQLTQLNLANGNNKNLYLTTRDNPNLMCIQIDRGFAPTINWTKDDHASYSDNCNYPSLSTTEVKAEQTIQILNPVKDNLVIKTTAKIERVEIYNTAGQLVKVLFKGNTQVQDLAKGIYLLKITTDKGVTTDKIIKQ